VRGTPGRRADPGGLLFFGDHGGGDQFAFAGDRVVVWEHETDARREVADGLRDYLTRSLTSGGEGWYVS
jgi:hypothetical protein